MKKIKIFIGSSIDDLAYERRDLVSFIAELNNKYVDRGIYIEPYICEEKSNEMRPEGSQKAHDDYIENDANALIFMFFRKAGKYTLRELQLAKDTLTSKNKKSNIFIYFKTVNNEVADTSEIKAAIDKIAGEYAHYYKKFSEADTIKLELLQYLSDALGENSLTIHNGKIYIGDIEANDIELSNVFAYQNNSELIMLKKELDVLEKQIQTCVEEKDWVQLAQLTDKHQKKQVQYNNLETEILKMLQQLFKCLREEKVNPIRLKALMLLEEGKHKEALLLLPLDEIKSKSNAVIEKKNLQEASIKLEAAEILQDGIARIRALGFDINNDTMDDETEKTYDSIIDVAIIAGQSLILLEYVDLLEEKGNIEKALEVAKLIEKNFEQFDDVNLYTKYDTYNLLSELSDNEQDSERYSNLARESLFDYINNLDKNNWTEYVDACLRLCDLFLSTKEILPFLNNAVTIMENHPDARNQPQTLHELYHTIAVLYKDAKDFEAAEKYFNMDIKIAEEQTTNIDNIADEFEKNLKEKKVSSSLPKETLSWQFKLLMSFEHLYEINAEKYDGDYIHHLLRYANLQLLNNKYQSFKELIIKAASVSEKSIEYKCLYEKFQEMVDKFQI